MASTHRWVRAFFSLTRFYKMKNTNQTVFHGKFKKVTSVFHASVLSLDHECCHNIVKVAVVPRGDIVRWIK